MNSNDPAHVDPLARLRTPDDPPCDVYLTGTVFLDIIFTGLDSAPVRGTESWARGMGSSPGGVANMATALARLGLRTSLAAAFGDDHYGEYCWDSPGAGRGHRPDPVPHGLRLALPGHRLHGLRGRAHHGLPRPRAAAGGARPRLPAARACRRRLPRPRRQANPGSPRPRAAGTRIFADVGWDDTGRWDLAGLADLDALRGVPAERARRPCATPAPTAPGPPRTPSPNTYRSPSSPWVPEGAYAVDAADAGRPPRCPPSRWRHSTRPAPGTCSWPGFVTGTLAGWPLADRLAFAGLTAALSVQEFGGLAVGARLVRDRRLVAAGAVRATARSRRRCAGTGSWRALLPEEAGRPWPLRRAVPTIGFGRST